MSEIPPSSFPEWTPEQREQARQTLIKVLAVDIAVEHRGRLTNELIREISKEVGNYLEKINRIRIRKEEGEKLSEQDEKELQEFEESIRNRELTMEMWRIDARLAYLSKKKQKEGLTNDEQTENELLQKRFNKIQDILYGEVGMDEEVQKWLDEINDPWRYLDSDYREGNEN